MRRNYADSSFSASSAGSASGSDVYPHNGHRALGSITPSPSPPATTMSFVHYAPGGTDNRQSYSNSGSNFYSVPSPLSNTHVLHPPPQQQSLAQQQQHINTTQLPPLGQLSLYAGRQSPMMPSASGISHSSLASSISPASYERERDPRDRDFRESLPLTPLSADGRLNNRRSILTQQ